MSVISTETAIANFKAGKYDGQRVFVLVKEPETLIRLMEGGVELPKVDLEIIRSKGVPIVIQYVPTDAEEAY